MAPFTWDLESPEFRQYKERIEKSHPPKWRDFAHPGYTDSIEYAEHVRAHQEGDPDNKWIRAMIAVARPDENTAQFDYRTDKTNFRANTKAVFGKIENILFKIFNPRLRQVEYPEMPAGLQEQSLKSYVQGMGFWQWARDGMFTNAISDPGAVVAIMPLPNENPMEMVDFEVVLFESRQVLDYVEGDYFTIWSNEKVIYGANNSVGQVLYIFDNQKILRLVQVADDQYNTELYAFHERPFLPVRFVPGTTTGGPIIKRRSFVDAALPALDEALDKNSDLTITVLRHAHPKFWQWAFACETCKGRGYTKSENEKVPCKSCNGTKTFYPFGGPLDQASVSPEKWAQILQSDSAPTNPVGGYLESRYEVIKYLEEYVRSKEQEALAALNMDHINRMTKMTEAAESRRIGKEDLHTYMLRVSEAVFDFIDWAIKTMANSRYGSMVSGDISDIYPEISYPDDFNLDSIDDKAVKLQRLTEAKASAGLVIQAELDLIRTEFGENSDEVRFYETLISLDPLPGKSPDDILTLRSMGGNIIREQDIYLHSNLERVLREAMVQFPDFIELPYEEQAEKVYAIVEEEMGEQQTPIVPVGNGP